MKNRPGFVWLFCAIITLAPIACAGWRAPRTGSAEARFGLHFEPVQFQPPQVNKTGLDNGITLYHYPEPNIPLVTVLVRVGVGSVNDPPGKVGAADLAAEVIRTGGTPELPGDELDRVLEARGAELSASVEREETMFRLSVLKEDLGWGMELLQMLLAQPAWPAAKLEEGRARRLVELRQRLDVPSRIAGALFPQLVYGRENPWGWIATQRTLDALNVDNLKAIYDRHYSPANMRVGLTGDVDWPAAQQVARRTLGALAARPWTPPPPPQVEPVAASRVYIVPRETTQNVIYFGHLGVERFNPDKFPIRVFNSVLSGGFTSRLFKEVRSNRGLAYSVSGRIGEGTVRGLYTNATMTKVNSAGETLELMLRINRDLRQEPPMPDEMTVAQQSEVNSFVFFFDMPWKIVHQQMILDAFGYPPDYLATYVDKLKAVSAEQVKGAAERHIHPERLVVLVVGKVDADFRKQLEAIGPVTEISDKALRAEWL